jgi:Fe-S oxidoreductase
MHIPTELFLIFARNSGIRTGDQPGTFMEMQVYSCSSCGICIDACQLNFSAGNTNIQSAYLLKGLRHEDDVSDIAHNCLMCGRCDVKCPVGIELTPVRMITRRAGETVKSEPDILKKYFPGHPPVVTSRSNGKPLFGWLPEAEPEKADVIYFAGCMTHLTPAIKNSMIKILDASGINYSFFDKDGGACCGRPLMLAGNDREARELINYNSRLIWKSGATTLVTSCPICYKVFKESYYLDVEVMHHSQFIKKLILDRSIKLNFLRKTVAFHTPCELGRRSGVYDEPKRVLMHVARLLKTGFEDENSLCCGGSLGNTRISYQQKNKIAVEAAAELTKDNPDILVTACPLCKKTFASATTTRVADIAEIVAEALSLKESDNIIPEKKLLRLKEPVSLP